MLDSVSAGDVRRVRRRRTVSGTLGGPVGVQLALAPAYAMRCMRLVTHLISNLGALGAMFFATAGLAGLGSCSVDGEARYKEGDVVMCRADLRITGAAERLVKARASPRRGRADRRARIHGFCIQNVGGNHRRGVTRALPRRACHWAARQNLCSRPSGRVWLQG